MGDLTFCAVLLTTVHRQSGQALLHTYSYTGLCISAFLPSSSSSPCFRPLMPSTLSSQTEPSVACPDSPSPFTPLPSLRLPYHLLLLIRHRFPKKRGTLCKY